MNDKIVAVKDFPLGSGRTAVAGQPIPLIPGFDYEKAARKGLIKHLDDEDIVNPASADAQEVALGGTDADEVAFLKEKLNGRTGEVVRLEEAAKKAQQEFDAKEADWEKQRASLLEDTANALKREDAYKEALGSELLPDDFPGRAALFTARYFTLAHLQGMDKDSLKAIKNIGDATADQILAKLEAAAPAPETKK